jgi:hypothetical protein
LAQLTVGTWDVRFTSAAYDTVFVTDVAVTPPTIVDLGNINLTRLGPTPRTVRISAADLVTGTSLASPGVAASEHPRIVDTTATQGDGAAAASAFRAPGDLSTVWRLDLSDPQRASFQELFGSPGLIQNPALSADFGSGRRYVAFVSNVDGDWELFVQRLSNWQADGPPIRIEPPGTSDNLACRRKVFHPRWIPGSSPPALLVTMTDCPDNGFEELGFDEDPWSIGEIRLWRVETSIP